jgi:hypothetical protein
VLYRRAWAVTDATVGALALASRGSVAWWPGDRSRLEAAARQAGANQVW